MTQSRAFYDFEVFFDGQEYFFDTYTQLQHFRLNHRPALLRPLQRFLDFLERVKEADFEEQLNLPDRYLSGLFFKARRFSNVRKTAITAAHEYLRHKISVEVQLAIDRFLPNAAERLVQQQLSLERSRQVQDEPKYMYMKGKKSSKKTYQSPRPGQRGTTPSPDPEVEVASVHPPPSRGDLKSYEN